MLCVVCDVLYVASCLKCAVCLLVRLRVVCLFMCLCVCSLSACLYDVW